MKTLETFLNELTASEELLNEFTSTKTKEEADAFLKAHDCDATVEEVAKAIQATEGEISDEDATAVAGGYPPAIMYVDKSRDKRFDMEREERQKIEEMKKNAVDIRPIMELIQRWANAS